MRNIYLLLIIVMYYLLSACNDHGSQVQVEKKQSIKEKASDTIVKRDWGDFKNAEIKFHFVNNTLKGPYIVRDSTGTVVERGNYINSNYANYIELYSNGYLKEKKYYVDDKGSPLLSFNIQYDTLGNIIPDHSYYIDPIILSGDTIQVNKSEISFNFNTNFPDSRFLLVKSKVYNQKKLIFEDSMQIKSDKVNLSYPVNYGINKIEIEILSAELRPDEDYRYRIFPIEKYVYRTGG